MNNDLYLKKFSDLYQVNFCTEQSNPAHNWSGFYHCRIDDLLFVSYSSNEDLNYVAGQGGSNSDDPICGGFSTWDEFLAKEAEALEELLNPIVNGVNPPQWIIFTCHQQPITCVRQAKMQKFIPVVEKYADLHIGGHQHNFSMSKPLRTGYNGTDPYNFYYDDNQSPKLQAALVDESGINKYGDKARGVRYLSINSSGWKNTGKQKNITKIEQYSSTAVGGSEFQSDGVSLNTTNFDYYADSMSPWWTDNGNYSKNGEKGASNVVLPTYAIIEANKDKLHVVVYQISNHLGSEEINGKQFKYSPDYNEVRDKMTRTVIYECEILQSDRADRKTR